mgnify:FL=1|jgi:hypothetical protein
MTNWLYQGQEYLSLEDFPENCIGFVYKIYNEDTGKIYIGKKILRNLLTKKLTLKEKSEWSKPGKVPNKTKVVKESDWAKYYGSCKPLLEDVKVLGPHKFKREIIEFCFNKKQLSYYEVFYQMVYEVLSTDSYNENIQGKWFRRDVKQRDGNQ